VGLICLAVIGAVQIRYPVVRHMTG